MRKPKIFAYIIIVFIAISVLWISRKIAFNYIFDKIITKTENKFGWDIEVKKADFTGFRTIYLANLKIKTANGVDILTSDSISIAFKPFPILLGKIRISKIDVYNTQITLNAEILRSIIQKTPTSKADTINVVIKDVNYAEIANNLHNKLFQYIPNKVLLRNFVFNYNHDSINSSVVIENFLYRNRHFDGDLLLIDKTLKSNCFITGDLNPANYSFSCKINNPSNSKIKFPYIGPRWQAAFGFDTLSVSYSFKEINSERSIITGNASVNNLLFYHNQVSPDTIVVNSGNFQYNWNINNNNIELDSSTVVGINHFSFSPYLKVQKDTSVKISFSFIRKEFDAMDLFSSLPDGLFSNFKGIKTNGKLAFHLKSYIDLNNPDSVVFESKLENIDFSIAQYGNTDFRLMNGSFIHEVYEKNMVVASFQVGPENPDFVALDQISPYLKFSVLTSEDGDFFYHRGFNEKAFRESISKNIKENRFARGGSTITMQLVKNVFLNRKKIISRKIEEALIVWIIENMHLTSKDRMFEVYLNIIEWGPGIYGINKASEFYFNKHPRDLNLSESIYLTSLIPRPKGFKYTFDNNGQIRDYMKSYYQLVSGIMVRRNQILPEDTINLQPISKLTGEARNFLLKPDSTNMEDSLFFIKPIGLIPQDFIK